MAQRTNESILAEVEGLTVPKIFMRTLEAHADRPFLHWREGDDTRSMKFAEYGVQVATAVAGLAKLGVTRGDRVVMMLRNVPEFHVLDLAVLFLGATPISVYNSSAPDQIEYLVQHCEAKVAIVEDTGFYDRLQSVRANLPSVHSVVLVRGEAGDAVSWSEFMGGEPVNLADHVDTAQPEDLATIIYTSGTTGNPKGVMLDHVNVTWTIISLRESFEEPDDDEVIGARIISYLPMAHIAERTSSHYMGLTYAYEVTCCPEASQIAAYAREVKPQIMFGVPRVWEKVYGGVNAVLAADPEKGQQFADAIATAIPIVQRMDWGEATQEDIDTWNFLDAVAFSTVRGLVGLDELKLAITGAAPIPAEMIEWFRAIGVNLCEIYGMSESTGPMTFVSKRVKPGTVGPAIPGGEIKLGDDGEVLYYGANVFKGYLNEPEKTAEALSEDGWLHSGDIGEIDEDGYLRIVDRKKELIITAGGKNISPANLEAALKMMPLIAQACAIGDQRPFVSALVVLDPEYAPVWAAQHGIEGSLAELAEHPAVREEIETELEKVMAGFNQAERVKKIVIVGEEWMPDSDVLTPTSKLKRRGIHARYADVIDGIYQR